ncbi:MAG TPA: hypothetical protein VN922_13130 [Bacteroidia bacterium]|nr:hypothetical protein [Bacteroidia bacterium]
MTNSKIDFFKQNETRIGVGKHFEAIPPLYYHSLEMAFANYFLTFSNNQKNYDQDFFDFIKWTNVKNIGSFSFNYNGNSKYIVFTILSLHRFFELLLKDILRDTDPFLAVKFFENSKQLIEYLNSDLNAEDVKTIEYDETFKRFTSIIEYCKDNPNLNQKYAHILRFSFFAECDTIDTLRKLHVWRNRIMHNGNTLPNIYLMDYIMSQKIVPLILRIVNIHQGILKDFKKPFYFETNTGINILEQIDLIKYNYLDFYDKTKQADLAIKYCTLLHLKELGSAGFSLLPFARKNQSFDHPYDEETIKRFERFAEVEERHEAFSHIKRCPCCGLKTLVVYKKTKNVVVDISWVICTACGYSLGTNIGDPFDFKVVAERVFA